MPMKVLLFLSQCCIRYPVMCLFCLHYLDLFIALILVGKILWDLCYFSIRIANLTINIAGLLSDLSW